MGTLLANCVQNAIDMKQKTFSFITIDTSKMGLNDILMLLKLTKIQRKYEGGIPRLWSLKMLNELQTKNKK